MPSPLLNPILSKDERAKLANEMEDILRGTPHQRRRFLLLAEQQISLYQNLLTPIKQERDLLPYQLRQVADAGNAFARAIEVLNNESKNILENLLHETEGGHAEDFEHVVAAAKYARQAAKAAERHLEKPLPKSPGPSPGGDKAVIELVQGIAYEYEKVFGKRPSAAREGIFARALAQVLEACGVRSPDDQTRPLEIGESRLKSILRGP